MSARSGLVGKNLLAPFVAISGHFFHGPGKCKKNEKNVYFPWWANGPYSPGLGSCAGVILYLCSALVLRHHLALQLDVLQISGTFTAYNSRTACIDNFACCKKRQTSWCQIFQSLRTVHSNKDFHTETNCFFQDASMSSFSDSSALC